MDIEYKILNISKEEIELEENKRVLNQLINLSKEWAEEKCCPSYDANSKEEYIDRHLYVAISDGNIIGYALGDIKVLKEKTSYNEIGEKAFELDEIYVLKSHRNLGVGKELYKYIESNLVGVADMIGVIATSFKYKELLKFYVEDLGLSFNHALLVKRL